MDHKLLGKRVVLSGLQSSHKSINIFVIGEVVNVTTLKLLTKVGYEVSFLTKHDPNTTFGASHSISNVLEKLGRARSGTLINFSFKDSKAFVLSIPTWSPHLS